MLSDVFNIWQSWLYYHDCNPVSIYRSSSIWSQRWHSYTWKTLIIHQDEAKELVWFLPCNSLQIQKTWWYKISLAGSEWPPFTMSSMLHTFLHERTLLLSMAACQSSDCRSFLWLKSSQVKLQRPSNRHWLDVSFGKKQSSLLRLQYQVLWYNVYAAVKHHLAVTRSGTQIMSLGLFLYATAGCECHYKKLLGIEFEQYM